MKNEIDFPNSIDVQLIVSPAMAAKMVGVVVIGNFVTFSLLAGMKIWTKRNTEKSATEEK